MDKHMYSVLSAAETSWWYKGKSDVSVLALKKTKAKGPTLDYGAGNGAMFSLLSRFGAVDAYEPYVAEKTLKGRGYREVFATKEGALKQPFGLVALFDVVEHLESDVDFLRELKPALVKGGKVIITTNAYQWLWSVHDEECHHFRRYTRSSLAKAAREAGYRVDFISYWCSTLLFPAAIVRLMNISGQQALNLPPLLNAVFYGIMKVEAFLMRFFPLPFGLDLLAVITPEDIKIN